MDRAREGLKLSQVIEAMAVMVMEEVMEVMLDTVAMDRAREKLMLSQDTEAMVVMVMEEVMEVWWIQKLWIEQDLRAAL